MRELLKLGNLETNTTVVGGVFPEPSSAELYRAVPSGASARPAPPRTARCYATL